MPSLCCLVLCQGDESRYSWMHCRLSYAILLETAFVSIITCVLYHLRRCAIAAPVDPRPPWVSAPPLLVGREREQGILHEHLVAAPEGHGSLALIGGEAGIGKTALADWLRRAAIEQGVLVLVGRCYDLSETPPYGP
jgi:hypothetical protein